MSELRITAVIPSLNRPDLLRRALEAVLRCEPGPDSILVIDGSEDGRAEPVVDALRSPGAPPIRYLTYVGGLTEKRNLALAEVDDDVIVFFDDDARPEPDVFRKLAAAYTDAGVVGVTGRIIEPDDRIALGRNHSPLRRLLPGGGVDGTFTRYGYPRRLVDVDRSCDIQFMQGAFLSARTAVARQVGFDEHLVGYGLGEDEDFSCRLSRLGRVRYLGDAVVHHDNTGFSTRDRRAFSRRAVLTRTYLFRKNFPQTPLARAQFQLLIALTLAHRLANRDWAGARGVIEGALDVWRGRPLVELSPAPPTSRRRSPVH